MFCLGSVSTVLRYSSGSTSSQSRVERIDPSFKNSLRSPRSAISLASRGRAIHARSGEIAPLVVPVWAHVVRGVVVLHVRLVTMLGPVPLVGAVAGRRVGDG